MKIQKYLFVLVLITGLVFGSASCVVVNTKHDNGLHKGWYKKDNKHPDKHPAKHHDDKKKKGKK